MIVFNCLVDNLDYLSDVHIAGKKQFSIKGGESQLINWEEYGLRIDVPGGSLLSTETADVAVVALVGGQFAFPENTILVSAVYAVALSKSLQESLKIEMQHCVCLAEQPSLTKYLKFATAPTNGVKPPYRFVTLEGGEFNCDSSYGTISCRTFSFFCILGFVTEPIDGYVPGQQPEGQEQQQQQGQEQQGQEDQGQQQEVQGQQQQGQGQQQQGQGQQQQGQGQQQQQGQEQQGQEGQGQQGEVGQAQQQEGQQQRQGQHEGEREALERSELQQRGIEVELGEHQFNSAEQQVGTAHDAQKEPHQAELQLANGERGLHAEAVLQKHEDLQQENELEHSKCNLFKCYEIMHRYCQSPLV